MVQPPLSECWNHRYAPPPCPVSHNTNVRFHKLVLCFRARSDNKPGSHTAQSPLGQQELWLQVAETKSPAFSPVVSADEAASLSQQ